MQTSISDAIEPGSLTIRILTTNETNVTLQTDKRFEGAVVQPGAAASGFIGEHGLAAWVEVKRGDRRHAVLFDTGGINASILHNLGRMNLKLGDVDKVIISHGHFDHTGSLVKVLPELKAGCELFIHPSSYVQNHMVTTNSGEEVPLVDFSKAVRELKKAGKVTHEVKLPALDKAQVEKLASEHGVRVIETGQPVDVCPGAATSGEVELFDPLEVTPGFYLLKSKADVEKHTFRDEIALYMNVKGKGLVILTGCGHTGILNTIRHGQKLTGIERVHAVIGGFHLEMSPETTVERTIQALRQLDPAVLCGMHCTGLAFNAKMLGSDAHVQGVVGTEFRF
ncbi:MAG: MBL fold metallo-hydrolase [Candidatus Lokiarchaeota archaeon]|nr:MBL fold metallo-hydrolase [Candidatus Lokiarchaeota archaeon]